MSSTELHSADYFGSERDFWWNEDFLALMAKRCRFEKVSRVLDVGCGLGHWSRALLPHLPPQAEIVGVDSSPRWIAGAAQSPAHQSLSDRLTFQVGSAEALPFDETAFDLVTCQTLLIHVKDCRVALREMHRVMRSPGRLLVAEPNSLASSLVCGSTSFHRPIAEKLNLVELQAICERGKDLLGEGNNSIGDLLPGIIAESRFANIEVYQSDKPTPLIPPFANAAQQAAAAQALDFPQRDLWIWSKEETLRYFVAGGGQESDFEALWRLAVDDGRSVAEAIRRGVFHTAGGSIMYLITAVK